MANSDRHVDATIESSAKEPEERQWCGSGVHCRICSQHERSEAQESALVSPSPTLTITC